MLLSVRNVHKSFGGVQALDDVSIDVSKGGVVGVIGPNGSGKSTLFNAICGFCVLDKGEILFKGDRIEGLPPYEIARRGLVKSFQICRVPERMTVLENMLLVPKDQIGESLLGAFIGRKRYLAQEQSHKKAAVDLLDWVGLKGHANEYAGNLSGGQKKLLVLARILMAGPEMILLDEPTAGVNRQLANRLMGIIRSLGEEQGFTFLIIEHNMKIISSVCDKCYVLDCGKVLAEGAPVEVQQNEKVLEVYLSSSHARKHAKE